jgi:putative restriction endonuclease
VNSLERALLEKLGHDNGFEHIVAPSAMQVCLGSARHRLQVALTLDTGGYTLQFLNLAQPQLLQELQRSFPAIVTGIAGLVVPAQDELARLLRRSAALASALPNQAAVDYDTRLKEEVGKLPPQLKGTEVERLVRQRVGQDVFRQAMLDYWGNACAVTGLALPDVLRASHAKPWAKCASDAERLDVFNGFLLSANLDALFDRYLISFDDEGRLMVAPEIGANERVLLGLHEGAALRWLAAAHRPYLTYHRTLFSKLVGA